MEKQEDDRERIAQLGRHVDGLWQMIDLLVDSLKLAVARRLTLQGLLEEVECCRRGASTRRCASLQEGAENRIEFGPEYQSFREARRRLWDHASGSETPEEA